LADEQNTEIVPSRENYNRTSLGARHDLQIGGVSIPITRKLRVFLSLVGLGVLCAPASFFLSEFHQTRGIVGLGYSRFMLFGLACPLILMVWLIASQCIRAKWLSLSLSVCVAFSVVAAMDWWAPRPIESTEFRFGCQIAIQNQPLTGQPMPEYASVETILSEALAISMWMGHLVDIDRDRQSQKKTAAGPGHDPRCSILQEYESNFRAPAMVVRNEILGRLSVADRIAFQSAKVVSLYAVPRGSEDLSAASLDLILMVLKLQRHTGLTAEIPTKRWLVPIPPPVKSEPFPSWQSEK
jgi:hypothetical protein